MAINIGKNGDGDVTYQNPPVNRVLFPNISEYATPEAIEAFVNAWLDEHPEATTSVEDGSILPVKLDSANSPSGGYILSYNATAGKFEWVDVDSELDDISGEITALNKDLSQFEVYVTDSSQWRDGTINASTGANATNSNRIRTIYLPDDVIGFKPQSGYSCLIYAYNSSDEYVGNWTGTAFIKSTSGNVWFSEKTDLKAIGDYHYRLVAKNSDGTNVSASDATNILFFKYTDTSLTLSGKAADSKATGDEIASINQAINQTVKSNDLAWLSMENDKKYINSSDVEKSSNVTSHTGYILIPDNTIGVEVGNKSSSSDGQTTYYIGALCPNVLCYDANKTLVAVKQNENSTDDTITVDFPNDAVYVRINQPSSIAQDKTSIIRWIPRSTSGGVVGRFSGTFESKSAIDTGIILMPNTSYRIVLDSNITSQINVYRSGDSSVYKKLMPYQGEVTFTNGNTKGELKLYNYDSYIGDISITVYTVNSEAYAEKNHGYYKFYVGKDNLAFDFTSFTKCLFELKDDLRPKIIEVWEGDYNIFDEYEELWNNGDLDIYTGDNPAGDYVDYCVFVPKNTHIIGKGIVRLNWMPDPSVESITPVQCKCISPINVNGGCIIENLELHCRNGRYCLHNDGKADEQYSGAVQKYINLKMVKYANDTEAGTDEEYGFKETTGFGIDRAMHHVYENCTFINQASSYAFYGHSRGTNVTSENKSSDITLNNCAINSNSQTAVKFGNTNPTTRVMHIRTLFNSCYISGRVRCQLESSISDPCKNVFDVQYLNCGDVTMKINDADNPYIPVAYNTNLTLET